MNNSPANHLSQYDWKQIIIYTLYIIALSVSTNLTGIQEVLINAGLNPVFVGMFISILGVGVKKFIQDRSLPQ